MKQAPAIRPARPDDQPALLAIVWETVMVDPVRNAPVIAKPEVLTDQFRVKSKRGLRNGAEAERLRGQHEIVDVAAAIDGPVNAKRLIGVNHRHMRRAKEVEILQRLLGIGSLVAARDAERVVELEAAFAPALQIDAAIFARKRKIADMVAAGAGRLVDQVAERFFRFAARDHDLPRLAVAPRGGALRSA